MAQPESIVTYADQFGLFSISSVLLGCVGVVLAVGGIFAFLNLRSIARETAKAEAGRIAGTVAERAANDYIQAELPAILAAYANINRDAPSDEDADRVAAAQEGNGV